jgi:CBS domain-containing protein
VRQPASSRVELGMTTSFLRLTARDLMSESVVSIPQDTSLRDASELLSRAHVSGVPVVDSDGKCVGVLSATDFMRWAEKQGSVTVAASAELPRTCAFWVKQRDALGREVMLCTLPPGACSLQVPEHSAEGKDGRMLCREPYSVPTDWQVVQTEALPANAVRHHMTKDIVTASPDTSIRELTQMMLDAHIHRLIVVDEERRPIGVVSSTDVLAAVARCSG